MREPMGLLQASPSRPRDEPVTGTVCENIGYLLRP